MASQGAKMDYVVAADNAGERELQARVAPPAGLPASACQHPGPLPQATLGAT